MRIKVFLASLLTIVAGSVYAQQHKLTKIWQTDSVINLPESVAPDMKAGLLYVSQMGNDPNNKDGIGGVAKIGLDGKPVDLNWITGLNAPKGLCYFGNKLYAADLTDVVVVDIKKGKVERKIPIEGAAFLNDIAVDSKGIVYVSDSKTKKIHRIENNQASVYLTDINGVNGLKPVKDSLYIIGGKNLWKADAQKHLTKIAELPQGGDGLEPVGNGDFLFSSWSGYIFYVYADGRHELLLDTHAEKVNAADIGFDPVKRIVYVPTFWKKSVVAYQLK